jgi:hypothetical protein
MSVMYPLVIANTASITSLVRVTLYHRSTSVCHPQVEATEGGMMLPGKAPDAAAEDFVAQRGSNTRSLGNTKNQTAAQEAKSW